jgi:hypothetical protein
VSIQVAVFLAYFAIVFALGWYSLRVTRDETDYWIAGGRLGWLLGGAKPRDAFARRAFSSTPGYACNRRRRACGCPACNTLRTRAAMRCTGAVKHRHAAAAAATRRTCGGLWSWADAWDEVWDERELWETRDGAADRVDGAPAASIRSPLCTAHALDAL